MRNKPNLTPNRYNTTETSGSNKFVSAFQHTNISKGIVEKKDRKYNWLGYKWAIVFTLIIGYLSYLLVNYLMF